VRHPGRKQRYERHRNEGLEREHPAHAAVAEPVEGQVDGKEHRPETPAAGIGDEDRQPRRLAGDEAQMCEHDDGEGGHARAIGNALRVFERSMVGDVGHVGPVAGESRGFHTPGPPWGISALKKMQGGGAVAMPQQGGGGGGREGQVWLGAWRVAWHVTATGTLQTREASHDLSKRLRSAGRDWRDAWYFVRPASGPTRLKQSGAAGPTP
jgi:hypothetical protein